MKEFRLDEISNGKAILRTSRILVFALAMGVIVFGIIAAVIVLIDPKNAADVGLPIVAFIMAFFGATSLIMSFVMPKLMAAQSRRQIGSLSNDDDKVQAILQLYTTKTIIGSAFCEGGAFGNLVAVIVEQQWWSFGIVGVLLLAILSRFPTEGGIENFVRQQVELADLEQRRGE